MSIRLRKEEREALVSALETDYESPEAAAGAIFSLAYDLIAKRDQVALYVRWGPGVVIGPFPGQVEAKKAGRAIASTFAPEATEGAVRVIPLASPAVLSTGLTEPPRGTPGVGYCPTCEHPRFAHLGVRWMKPKAKTWQPPGCTVSGCKCKETT